MSSPPPPISPALAPSPTSFANVPKRLLPQDNQNRASPPQATPKPPKKRYLESTEFRDLKHTPSQPSPKTSPTATASISGTSRHHAARESSTSSVFNVGGPPILDVETMNRVIEKALRGYSCDPSSSKAAPSETSHNLSVSDLNVSLKACEHSMKNAPPKGGRDTSTPPSANGTSRLGATSHKTASSSSSESTFFTIEDKPLNLSSSKVLHTSNQQIIDHYIDKFLSKKSTAGFTVPAEIMESPTLLGCKQGPFHPTGSSIKTSRKERTCKGKRYLEMLSENKAAKRKASQMSDENVSKPGTSPKSNAAGSKWVSGNFNLEEKIAELPQIEDKYLVNVYSKSMRSVNGGGKSSPPVSCSPPECGDDVKSDKVTTGNSPLNGQCCVETEKCSTVRKEADHSSKQADGRQDSLLDESRSAREQQDSNKRDNCKSPASQQQQQQQHQPAGELLEPKGGQGFVSRSQGIECDGLTALAEVALQQAKRTEVTSAPAV